MTSRTGGHGRILAAVRSHRLFLAVFALAAALRMLVLLAYRPALLFFGDSLVYLQRGADLQLDKYRPSLYSLFLAPVLPLHELWIVPALQHLMGLGMGAALYLLLRRWGVGCLGATAASLPVLLDGYQLNIEQFVMAETLFEALVAAAVVALTWQSAPGRLQAALAGLLVGLAGLTRSIGVVLVVPFLGYVLLRRLGVVRALALAAGFAVPVAGYAAFYRAQTGALALSGYDGHFLYARVAPFTDCRGLAVPSAELRVLCPRGEPAGRPSPNWYLWDPHSPAHVLERRVGPSAARRVDPVLRDFAIRLMVHRPREYLASVGDFLLRYLRRDPAGDGRIGQSHLEGTFGLPEPNPDQTSRVLRTFDAPDARLRVDAGLARLLGAYQRTVHTRGPLLAATFVLGLAAIAVPAVPGARRLRAEAVLLASCGMLLVVVSAALSTIDYRYLLPSLVLLPPAGVMGATMLVRRGRAWRGSYGGVRPGDARMGCVRPRLGLARLSGCAGGRSPSARSARGRPGPPGTPGPP